MYSLITWKEQAICLQNLQAVVITFSLLNFLEEYHIVKRTLTTLISFLLGGYASPGFTVNGHPTRFSVARFSGFFFLFIFFDRQFRLFSYSDSNTYLDTEISIISLRFGGLEITLV